MKTIIMLITILMSVFIAKSQNISTKELLGEWKIIFHSEDACDLDLKISQSSNKTLLITNKGLGENTLGEWCKTYKFNNVKLSNSVLTFSLIELNSEPMTFQLNMSI